MRKAIFYLFLTVAIIGVIFYFTSGLVLKKLTVFLIDQVAAVCVENDVKISATDYAGVGFSAFNAVTWRGVTFVGGVTEKSVYGTKQEFAVRIEKVTVAFKDLASRTFMINISGAKALSQKYKASSLEPAEGQEDDVEDAEFKVEMQLVSYDPREILYQIKGMSSVVTKFFRDGRTKLPVEFSGQIKLKSEKRVFKQKIFIQREGEDFVMVMDKNDLKNLSDQIMRPLTGMELDLFSRNPLRVPRLMRIREYAYDTATKKHKAKPSIPEDPYRHIVWGYLLTNAFGDAFAKEVTFAHENVPEFGVKFNSEQTQDLANDAAGRRYARSGYSEISIEDRMMTDPEVILIQQPVPAELITSPDVPL